MKPKWYHRSCNPRVPGLSIRYCLVDNSIVTAGPSLFASLHIHHDVTASLSSIILFLQYDAQNQNNNQHTLPTNHRSPITTPYPPTHVIPLLKSTVHKHQQPQSTMATHEYDTAGPQGTEPLRLVNRLNESRSPYVSCRGLARDGAIHAELECAFD